MVLIDTDVLAIQHIFTKDERYIENNRFIKEVVKDEPVISMFNLLELCGILSTAGHNEKARVLYDRYLVSGQVSILYPATDVKQENVSWKEVREELFKITQRGLRLGNATVLWVAEINRCSVIVTWNEKHYKEKTKLEVITPKEYLNRKKLQPRERTV